VFTDVLQDKKYDAQIGVKSTALRFNDQPRLWMAGFASSMTCGLTATGWLCQQAWPYYLGVGLFAAHVGHQVSRTSGDFCDPCRDLIEITCGTVQNQNQSVMQ